MPWIFIQIGIFHMSDSPSEKRHNVPNSVTKRTKNNTKRDHNGINKPFDEPMSPEFRKVYLKELIKFTEERINEAKEDLKRCQKCLTEAENASNNLTKKIALINSLKRSPSEKALNLIEFLKVFLSKYHEKMAKEYEQASTILTIALEFNNDEIKKYYDELDALNNELKKN